MAFNYQFPRIGSIDTVTVLNAPSASDYDLDKGTLTVKDSAGSASLVVRACDFLAFDQTDFTAGTPHSVDVDLTSITLVDNRIYSMTVTAPNVRNFFGGGRETGAIYQTRTYNISSDLSATVGEIQASFVAAIAADPGAYFTASAQAGDVVRITAASADAGALEITAPAGSTLSDNAAFVAPVGTEAEVLAYGISPAIAEAAGYDRYIIKHRKFTRSNAISGLQAVLPAISLVYLKQDAAGTGAAVTAITAMLAGTHTPVADYLGCPAL